jgi:interleukin-1 receptor-associated kinase 1
MIGDFGLSREGHLHDECMEVSRVFGTRPYLPQEFLKQSLLSTKVDIFSFGVVLFELATGFKNYDKLRTYQFLYDHMARVNENSRTIIQHIIDPTTPNDEACLELCRLMVSLGKTCTNVNPNYRPEMMSVLKALENFVPLIPVENCEAAS